MAMAKSLTPEEQISVQQIVTMNACITCAVIDVTIVALRQLRSDGTLNKRQFQNAVRKSGELKTRLVPIIKNLVIDMAAT